VTRIFVSYAHADSRFAQELRVALVQNGHEVWLDADEIDPSVDWRVSVERALANAKAVVFVASTASLRSQECLHELRQAAAHGKRIVAITLPGVGKEPLPAELAGAPSIDAGDRTDLAAVIQRLDRAL
jgi:transcriptional regulator GlxA family with amidase domain